MADNKVIVRDVTRPEQAKTVTPDYQSPNGFGVILEGFNDALGNFISGKGSRGGSGGGGNAYNTDLYNLYKGAAEDLSASDMGEEEFILFDKRLHQKALLISGGDYGAIDKAMSLAQYKPFAANLQKLYTRDAANQYAQMDLVNTAGTAAVGVDAPADIKEQAGIDYLNRQLSSNSFIDKLAKASPAMQEKLINAGTDTPGLTDTYVLLKQGFMDFMIKNQGVNPGVLYNKYYNDMVSALTNGGMDMSVANKLVDRALSLEKATIYGDSEESKKASSSFGRMSLANDYQTKQNALDSAISESNFLAKKFRFVSKVRDPATGKYVDKEFFVSGADLGTIKNKVPENVKILSDLQYLELVPQLYSSGAQTYSSNDLNFFVSTDAGKTLNLNANSEDKTPNTNVVTGQNQLLEASIKEKNSADPTTLVGKGFADIKKFVDVYGNVKSEALNGVTNTVLLDIKDNSFRSIAKGSNIESGREGFWQVDDKGNLHYYRGVKWMGKDILLDATDSVRFMGLGSEGAANMRRYAPTISQWLKVLEDKYGIDKSRLYEDFNRSQIRDTVGAQSFRVNQLRPSNAYYEGLTMQMNDEDINSVLQAVTESQLDIEGVSLGIAGRALKDVGSGVIDAAELAGKAPGAIPGAVIVEGAIKPTAAATEALTGGLLGVKGQEKQTEIALQRASQQPTASERTTATTAAPRETAPYGAEAIQRNNPGNIKKNPRNKWKGMSAKQDDSDFVTFNSLDAGYRAMSKILDSYFKGGDNSVAEIVSRYAPPSENPTDDYIEFVAQEMNVDPSQPLKNTPEIKAELIRAMVKFENGAVPRTIDQIEEIIRGNTVKPVSSSRELPANASGFEYTGNYDLGDRQVVQNPDGTISTEYSIVIEEDGEYIVIPTVIGGRIVPEEEAVEFYHRTGLNHGKYKSEKEAVKASKEISKIQAKRYLKD